MPLDFTKVTADLESFGCFDRAKWPHDAFGHDPPFRKHALEPEKDSGPRTHTFTSIWERTLDPMGKKKDREKVKSDEYSIDWKKWPPQVAELPRGIKIPVTEVPHHEMRLSISGRWDHFANGTTVVPIHSAGKEFFDKLGGYLNVPKSEHFRVSPASIMFLLSKVGQSYSGKITLYNAGKIPRRVTVLSPLKPGLTVFRETDPNVTVSCGGQVHFTVHYKPKNNHSLNDILVLYGEDDGAVTVPIICSGQPEPILEVEEWNCGCCIVGVPRTINFEVKNIGGGSRFWILSEDEFNNEYIECYLKYQRDLIKENARDLLTRHTEDMIAKMPENVVKKSMEMAETKAVAAHAMSPLHKIHHHHHHHNNWDSWNTDSSKPAKLSSRIYTKAFRISPTCFRLQKMQKIDVKVKFFPKSACFHYEKLAILCDNGEVRWIAVKGLGIAKNSPTLIEVKAKWAGPPVDLALDPRTKLVLDCGDLIGGELATVMISIANKSCIPLYYFWAIRPLVQDPGMSPDTTEIKLMERFYEYTIFEGDSLGNALFTEGMVFHDHEEEEGAEILPLKMDPAQGLIERKQELQIAITVKCPRELGYHACVVSLYAEQVDDMSKATVMDTLKELDKDQITMPISHVALSKQLQEENRGFQEEDDEEGGREGSQSSRKSRDSPLVKLYSQHTNSIRSEDGRAEDMDDMDDFISLKQTIKETIESRMSMAGPKQSMKTVDENLLPLAITKRSTFFQSLDGTDTVADDDFELDESMKPRHTMSQFGETREKGAKFASNVEEFPFLNGDGPRGTLDSIASEGHSLGRRESINLHLMPLEEVVYDTEHDRAMNQGHGVYEDLRLYTENVIPRYKLWPGRTKGTTPVTEVEIWLKSVPLDITFHPPFLIASGTVKSKVERLFRVKNGTGHRIRVHFHNIKENPIPVTCSPGKFNVEPYGTGVFKAIVYFEKCGQIRTMLKGSVSLPFISTPCAISCVLKSEGPYLEVNTPTLNFSIVPLLSETMKTLSVRNSGNRAFKWIARIPPLGLQDEHKRDISGHQNRVYEKHIFRIWPNWGLLEPGESAGFQVYFSAEFSGEIVSYVEIMVEGNVDSMITVPIFGVVEDPLLVLEKGCIEFYEMDFVTTPVQKSSCTLINPTGFNIAFVWECTMGKQNKLCNVHIHPRRGIVLAKQKMHFTVSVESLVPKGETLMLDNLFLPCCVKGMKEPLILKIATLF